MQCKSIVLVQMRVLHYKSCFQGKSALQILFLMLRKFVMHLYEYDTFAVHRSRHKGSNLTRPKPTQCSQDSEVAQDWFLSKTISHRKKK